MLYIYKYNMLNPEIVISICNDKLSFDTKDKKNYFRKYIKKNDKNHIPTQLALLYANNIMNNQTIIAEPIVNKVVEKPTKPTKPKVDTKQIKQLKEEIKGLKKQLVEIEEKNNEIFEESIEKNNQIIDLTEKVKDHKKYEEIKTKEINRLNKIIDTLPYEYKKKFKKPSTLTIGGFDNYSISESDDEIQNELDKDLN